MKVYHRISVLILSLVVISSVGPVKAQKAEPIVHDSRPTIVNGPYLLSPSETGITVVWTTDTPSHSRVLYGTNGALTEMVEPSEKGLKPVGTLHAVRLTDLKPGQTYQYRVVSTQVVKLKPYISEKGQSVESPIYTFTTPDRSQQEVVFSFITDTQHENVERINANLDLVDWDKIDFLVHGGDALSHVDSHEQIFTNFIDPITARLEHRKPMVYVRGNHETRGPYARSFYDYVPSETGEYYYTFDAGPVHFIVLDTGEDKADDHVEYSGLNDFASYQEQEFEWFTEHIKNNRRVREAAFVVLLMHNPRWGYVDDVEKRIKLANEAGVDLVISGHLHRFVRMPPGERGNDYTTLVVGQDQIATVVATESKLDVVVTGENGEQLDAFTIEN